MKILENLTNVIAPSMDFPYGDLNNNTGTNNGTPVNKDLLNDIIQFGQKLADEAGITMNDTVDNATNGWQLYEAFRKLTRPYKVYTVLATQSSTNAPTITVLENTLGGVPVWSYSTTGEYLATLAGAFVSGKTAIFIQDGVKTAGGNYYVTASRVSDNVIAVFSSDASFNGINGGISNRTIEIRVYD